MSDALLKQEMDDGSLKEHKLTKMVTTMGRSLSNDIVVEDKSLSRLHVRIENRNGQFYVLDNNSSNGTYVNRKKVGESLLQDGDTINTGRISFQFCRAKEDDDMGSTQKMGIAEEDGPGPTVSMKLGEDGMLQPPSPALPELPKRPKTERPDLDEALLPPKVPAYEDQDTASSPVVGASGGLTYATPVQRLLAFLLDVGVGIILSIPGLIVGLLDMAMVAAILNLLGSIAAMAHIIVGWLKYGKTVGKHLLNLRIIEEDKADLVGLTPKTMVMRILGYFVCAIPCYLGFLYIFFNEDKMGLQDKIAKTRVIKD